MLSRHEFRSLLQSCSLPQMATDKRDRQRANRAEKQAAEAKAARRQNIFALVKKYARYAAFIVVALLIITFLT